MLPTLLQCLLNREAIAPYLMSFPRSDCGGGIKSEREQQEVKEEEEDGPASMQVTAHPTLAVVKSHLDTLVWLQLCSPQGADLLSFVRLLPRVFRPFAGAPLYDMSLTRAERLHAVGCVFKGKLVRLLSLGVGRHFEPQRNRGASCKTMLSIVRRVAVGLAAAVRDKPAREAEVLCASGRCSSSAAARH